MASPGLADLARITDERLVNRPPCPEVPDGHRLVFVLDSATGLEDRLLRSWAARCAGRKEVLALSPSRLRRPGRGTERRVGQIAGEEAPSWLVPLRVVWMPAERHGRRAVSWLDVLKLGDPRDPRWFRDYLILALHPDRVRVVVGEGASAAELRQAHASAGSQETLGDFVTRRARRALDRAERQVRGNRYKIPRFLAEDIVNRPSFRQRAVELGRGRGLSEKVSLARARYYLAEMAASHSPYLIDLIANLIHWVIRQGYGAIHYDRRSLEMVARLGRDHPLVFLPSHKSNLDRLSLQFVLWENDLPPNHTAGGINMNFFPVGPLVRRTGVFFIRRSFKGNELYKFVLRTYLDYLVEKRFPLEWYMEGGRSRSGKLRPPRYGMLSWVVDSLARGMADDLYLLPISIAYDQIQEVGDYVREATGGDKQKETFSWALKFARSLRRRYGDIHIRFAEPISVATELADADLADDDPIEVQKLAFEVMYRISMVTPVTPTALVSTVLISARGQAQGIETVATACRQLVDYIERRRLPTTIASLPSTPEAVSHTIALMDEHGLVSSHSGGGRTVYWMDAGQKLRAAYYANSVVHFFVPRGLAEIALTTADDVDAFRTDLLALRDLFKFEFFFAEKDEFVRSVSAELTIDIPEWEKAVGDGHGSQLSVTPSTRDWAVLPLLEAYQVVADELAATTGPVEERAFLASCLDRGRLYRLEGRIASDESVSQAMFGGAYLLADNRDLLGDGPEVDRRRAAFAAEIARFNQTARSPSSV